jgi:hypothetical protein
VGHHLGLSLVLIGCGQEHIKNIVRMWMTKWPPCIVTEASVTLAECWLCACHGGVDSCVVSTLAPSSVSSGSTQDIIDDSSLGSGGLCRRLIDPAATSSKQVMLWRYIAVAWPHDRWWHWLMAAVRHDIVWSTCWFLCEKTCHVVPPMVKKIFHANGQTIKKRYFS